jgi:hypothetical protein
MNYKRSSSGQILRYYAGICLERLRKTMKASVRIVGLRPEI